MKGIIREIADIDLSPWQAIKFLLAIWLVGGVAVLFVVAANSPHPVFTSAPDKPSAPTPMEVSVASAYKLCAMFDATGLGSRPCQVDGFDVNVTVDMVSNQARIFCAQIDKVEDKANLVFNSPRWRMNIYSPYSGDSTIAFCPL
jgi:hypothetical protein